MATVKTITIRVVTDAQAKDLAKVQSTLKGITTERNKLIKAQAEGRELTKKEAETLTRLTKEQISNREAQRKLNQSTKNLINSNNAANGSYDQLVARTAVLRQRLRELPNSFDKNNVAARRLKDQIRENTERLKEFDKEIGQNFRNVGNYAEGILEAERALRKEEESLKENIRALKIAATQTDKNSKEQNEIQKELKQTQERYKQVNVQLNQYNVTQNNSTTILQSASTNFSKLAAGITAGIIAFRTIQRVVGGTIDTISNFEDAQADLAAVTRQSIEDISGLTDEAIRLAGETKFTATQVSELQKELAKLGFTSDEILNATGGILDLAAATGTDLANAATVAGNTIRAFGLDTEETDRAVNVMAASFSASALDIEKFSTAISVVAPVAASAGFSLERTTALLGVLVDRGVDASTAGTGLRNVFLELSKQGITLEEALTEIEQASDRNAVALDLFGKRGATIGTILATTGDAADKLQETITGTTEATDQAAKRLDTFSGDVLFLESAWEKLILTIDKGDSAISGGLRNAAQTIKQIVEGLTFAITTLEQFEQQGKDSSTEFDKSVRTINEGLDENRSNLLELQTQEIVRIDRLIAANEELNKSNQEQIKDQRDFVLAGANVSFFRSKDIKITEAVIAQRKGEIEALQEARRNLLELNFEIKESTDITQAQAEGLSDVTKAIEGQGDALSSLTEDLKEFDKVRQEIIGTTTNALAESIDEETKARRASLDQDLADTQFTEEEKLFFLKDARERQLITEEGFQNRLQSFTEARIAAEEEAEKNQQFERERALQTFQTVSAQTFTAIANIQQAQLNRELRAAEGNEEEQEKIRIKFAKKRQQAAIAQAIINGALAVTLILRSEATGNAVSDAFVKAALVAAQVAATATQVGLIADQEFAQGGLLQGASHAQGGIPVNVGGSRVVEAEGGEAIINKRSTAMFTPLLSAINEAGGGVAFAQQGTIVPTFAAPTQTQAIVGQNQNASLIQGLRGVIAQEVSALQVVNVATDTATVANTAANIESRATFG